MVNPPIGNLSEVNVWFMRILTFGLCMLFSISLLGSEEEEEQESKWTFTAEGMTRMEGWERDGKPSLPANVIPKEIREKLGIDTEAKFLAPEVFFSKELEDAVLEFYAASGATVSEDEGAIVRKGKWTYTSWHLEIIEEWKRKGRKDFPAVAVPLEIREKLGIDSKQAFLTPEEYFSREMQQEILEHLGPIDPLNPPVTIIETVKAGPLHEGETDGSRYKQVGSVEEAVSEYLDSIGYQDLNLEELSPEERKILESLPPEEKMFLTGLREHLQQELKQQIDEMQKGNFDLNSPPGEEVTTNQSKYTDEEVDAVLDSMSEADRNVLLKIRDSLNSVPSFLMAASSELTRAEFESVVEFMVKIEKAREETDADMLDVREQEQREEETRAQ